MRPELVGTEIDGYPVYSGDKLAEFVFDNKVDIAILSVPRRAAQELTDRLIGAGIRGIWNFTNIELETGDSGVLVENIHFSDSFLALTYYLAEEDDDRK